MDGLLESIGIIRKYYDDAPGYRCEHDKITFPPTDRRMSDEDVARFRQLEWTQNQLEGSAPYDPSATWSNFELGGEYDYI